MTEKPKTLQELFSDPSKWTRGAFARDINGLSVMPQDHEAVCWCLSGGIAKLYSEDGQQYHAVMVKVREALPLHVGSIVISWNDSKDRTFEEVVGLVTELNI